MNIVSKRSKKYLLWNTTLTTILPGELKTKYYLVIYKYKRTIREQITYTRIQTNIYEVVHAQYNLYKIYKIC